MKTGIIMEINERFLTLLTPEGEFLRARKQDRVYVIGQEIDFFPLEQENGKKSSSLPIFNVFRGKAIFAAAFALLLAVVSFLPFYQSEEVYAYMSIDVNPSIELGVNEKHQVIELVPYNEDGKLIVEKIKKWKKENIQAVAEKILHQLKEQGYLKENKEMVIAAVYADEEKNKEDDVFQAELTEIKEAAQNEQLEVTLIEASEEDREEAVEKGITTGVYKENQLKANRKSSEKEKASSENATVEKEVSQEEAKKSAETPPGQLKKQEKPVPAAANMDKPKTQIEKTPAPGQTKKSEHDQKANQNQSDKSNRNKNTQNNKGNSVKENNEKKNESNSHSKNKKVQLSNKNNSESKGNGKKPENSAKNKEKNNKQ